VNKTVGGWVPYRHFEYVVGDVEPSYMMAMRLDGGQSKGREGKHAKESKKGKAAKAAKHVKGAKGGGGKEKSRGRAGGAAVIQTKRSTSSSAGERGKKNSEAREGLQWLRLGEKSAPWTRTDGTKLCTKHGRSRRPAGEMMRILSG
jgi:hypothetical protein